jgi:hypothetical protein
VLYTKNAGDLRAFWQGPMVGWDFGGEGARTMMLVYSLPATAAISSDLLAVSGSAYFVGGLGMTALTASDIVLVPIRGRITAGGQCRLSEIHTASHLESVLTGAAPGARTDGRVRCRDRLKEDPQERFRSDAPARKTHQRAPEAQERPFQGGLNPSRCP